MTRSWQPRPKHRKYTGLIVALCGALLVLSGLLIGFALMRLDEAQEFSSQASPTEPPPEFGPPVGMTATFYAEKYCGRKTASGVVFDCQSYTAAHRTLPLFTKLRLRRGERTIIVTVNDRGPFDRDRSGNYRKDLDLSPAAFAVLSPNMTGGEGLRVEVRKVL